MRRIGAAAGAALLLSTACAAEDPHPAAAPDPLIGSEWLAEDIQGGGVVDRLQTTLSFLEDGRVAGTGGCNRYTGPVEVNGSSIRFGSLAATMMACPPAAMNQEQRFFHALTEATGWKRTPEQKLVLSNATGQPIVVMSRIQPAGG